MPRFNSFIFYNYILPQYNLLGVLAKRRNNSIFFRDNSFVIGSTHTGMDMPGLWCGSLSGYQRCNKYQNRRVHCDVVHYGIICKKNS